METNRIGIINIEGVDGIGKATIAEDVIRILKLKGYLGILKSYPDYNTTTGQMVKKFLNGAFGDPIKMDPKCACMPYTIDRHHDYDHTWWSDHLSAEFKDNKGICYVCDRSWFSNFFFQGAKIYMKPVFEAISSDFQNLPLLGIYKNRTELDIALLKLKDDVSRAPKELAKEYLRRSVAILDWNSTTDSEIRMPPVILIGHPNTPADKWKTYSEPYHFLEECSSKLLEFANWLYDIEVTQSKIADIPQHTFFITRLQSVNEIIAENKKAMIGRPNLDIYERSFTYQMIVQIFSQWIAKDMIVGIDDKYQFCPFSKLFTPLKNFHIIITDHIPGDPNDDEVQKKIKQASYACATEIVSQMEILNYGN